MQTLIKKLAVIAAFWALAAGAAVAMPVNGNFETGSLAPWYQDQDFGGTIDWEVTTDAISGTFSAFNVGNMSLRQDFAGLSVDNILSISFDLLTDGHTFNAYTFYYLNGTNEQHAYSGLEGVVQSVDTTSNLSSGLTLVGFSIYGNFGGATTFDNFNISVGSATEVPAPAALALFGAGLLGLGMVGRRRRA